MGLFYNTPKLEIITWDVQHGNAIFIKTPNDKKIVIDVGLGSYQKSSADFSPLNHLLIEYGINRIDYLIITHPHKDHIEDIASLRHFKIGNIITPQHIPKNQIGKNAIPRDEHLYNEYKKLLSSSYLPKRSLIFNDLKLKVFSPKSYPLFNLNNHSLFVVLLFNDLKFIIPGDNEFDSIEELMNDRVFRKYIDEADILWAPHHGRESAYHYHFVTTVNPLFTIISDTKNVRTSAANKYSRLSEGGIAIQRDGTEIERRLISTRKDGVVRVTAKKDFWGQNSFEVFVK